MHIVFASRGIKHERDRTIAQLSSMLLPWKCKDDKGEERILHVQNHLQPIELWSLVVPEEHTETMLRTLRITNGSRSFSGLSMLRKAMKLKKIPKVEPEGLIFPLWTDNQEFIGIGIREDKRNKYGNEQL